ncbi:MAG: hypothetical protein K2W92_02730 [Alphaproteobacteria bacterium]|nr:hypothetical protein [Alphaproteobacteria bacterium]
MYKIKLDKDFREFLLEMAEEDVVEYYWYWLEIGNKKYILCFEEDEEEMDREDETYEGWYIRKFSITKPDGSEVYFDNEFNLNNEDVQTFEKIRLTMNLYNKLPEKTKQKSKKI